MARGSTKMQEQGREKRYQIFGVFQRMETHCIVLPLCIGREFLRHLLSFTETEKSPLFPGSVSTELYACFRKTFLSRYSSQRELDKSGKRIWTRNKVIPPKNSVILNGWIRWWDSLSCSLRTWEIMIPTTSYSLLLLIRLHFSSSHPLPVLPPIHIPLLSRLPTILSSSLVFTMWIKFSKPIFLIMCPRYFNCPFLILRISVYFVSIFLNTFALYTCFVHWILGINP